MPIERYLVYEDNWDEEEPTLTVGPGELKKVATNYSGDEPQDILAHCLRTDAGGLVYQVNAADLAADGMSEALKHCKPETIRDGDPFKRTIKTESGRFGQLTLKLMLPHIR